MSRDGPDVLAAADLLSAAVVVVVVLTALVVPLPGALRYPAGLALTLLVPGYLLLAALFPSVDALGGVERLAFSVGVSLLLVGAVSVALGLTGRLVRPVAVGALAALAVLTGAAAAYRRARTPRERRFHRPAVAALRSRRGSGTDASIADDGRSRRVTVALAAVVLVGGLAAGTTAVAVTDPVPDERYTELSLLDAETGTLPTNATVESGGPVVVSVHSHEGRSTEYRVAVERRRVAVGNDSVRVLARQPVATHRPTLADGERWTRRHRIAPTEGRFAAANVTAGRTNATNTPGGTAGNGTGARTETTVRLVVELSSGPDQPNQTVHVGVAR